MSASLVGSEMCIRDSCIPLAPPDRTVSICPMLRGTVAQTQRTTPSGPVSYTHLTLPTICSV
eukprot:1975634-Alexandrium_andersonii.AAC.1